MRFYARLPAKAKPQAHEYTCLAAILVESPGGGLRVVGLGTGTKCVGAGGQCARGLVVNDCHAEVLARRAFVRAVLLELLARHSGGSGGAHCLLAPSAGNPLLYQLRAGLQLHLYISDSPCGEAAVYEDAGREAERSRCAPCSDDGGAASGEGVRRTGAKPVARGPAPLRTKSGRSDLPLHARTRSLCCSDKLARWAGLGLQSALLAHFLAAPLPLHSVTVSSGEGWSPADVCGAQGAAQAPPLPPMDSQLRALTRALLGRAGHSHQAARAAVGGAGGGRAAAVALLPLPSLRIALLQFGEGQAQRRGAPPRAQGSLKRPREAEETGAGAGSPGAEPPPLLCARPTTLVPSGTCLLAYTDSSGALHSEGLLGASGRKMGSSARTDPERAASSVCKQSMAALFAQVWRAAAAAAAAAASRAEGAAASAAPAPLSPGKEAVELPATYRHAKRAATAWTPGALLPLHLAAKAAWHSAQGGQEDAADFSTWPHCDSEKWESFALS